MSSGRPESISKASGSVTNRRNAGGAAPREKKLTMPRFFELHRRHWHSRRTTYGFDGDVVSTGA